MAGRITPLVNDEYYHIFNRGINKQNIFLQPRDFSRFRQTFYYYQFANLKQRFSNYTKSQLKRIDPNTSEKLVEIICYCLMPNHFHFLLKQVKDNGLSIFLSKISNSYTKYFNAKYKCLGPLLQGAFKSVRVENDEQLIHLSRYIHLNPVASNLIDKPENFEWSSYLEYIEQHNNICRTDVILDFFPLKREYQQFVEDQVEYAKSLDILKHKLIDFE